jgi:iron complex outermembrane receptor protein
MKKSIRFSVRGFARLSAPVLSVMSLACASSIQAQGIEINPVVVTATKFEEDSHNVPAFINVITRQQIEQAGASTVNEAIMRLAGVPGSPSLFGGNEYSLDMMGFGDTASSNMVVVIDGVPFREGDQSEVRLSSVPIDTVERIEVQRGGAGVLYGEGATAGVINIVTRASANNSPTRHTGTATASLGSNNTREYRAYANYVNETLDLSFSAQDRSSNGYRVNSKNDQQNGALSLKYTITEKTRVGLSVYRDDSYSLTPGALTLQEYQQNPRAAQATSLANKTFMSVKSERYAGFLDADVEGFNVRLDLVQRQRTYDALGVLYGAVTPMNFDSNNQFYGLTIRRTVEMESYRNTFVFGSESNDWNQNRIYPTQPAWGTIRYASNGKGNYIKNDLDVKQTATRISMGVRSEQFDRYQLMTGTYSQMQETVKAWELGVSQKLNLEHSIFARRSQSYRLPNLDELPTPIYVGLDPVPLLPQFDKTNEIGWKFNSSQVNSSVRFYQSDLTNEIIYDPVQDGNMNTPHTKREGVDAFGRFQVNPIVGLMTAYSHRRTQFAAGPNVGNKLPMAPQDVLTVRGDWRFVPNQTVGLGWMHVANQYIAGDFANQNSMSSYRVVDARYAYQMGASDISVVVRNLMDTKYYSYATTTGGYSVYPDLKRSLMFTLRHKF